LRFPYSAVTEPLTIEEHLELGRELRIADARLRELCELVTVIYGAESRVAFLFRKAAESVSRVRQEMQTQAALDVPGEAGDQIYL
jgi:hypothetical protein